ncbi:MAG: tetratricopeptide repeat protein [Deferribacterales bacterium]
MATEINLKIIFICFCLLFQFHAFASDETFSTYEEAKELYLSKTKDPEDLSNKIKQWPKIFKTFSKYSNEGNPEAITYLGQMYETGRGTKPNIKKAVKLYKQAFEMGEPNAKYFLSYLYLTGRGVSRNYDKARKMLEELLEAGDMRAAANLGSIYREGRGVKKDYKKAVGYYEIGATTDPASMFLLGYMYFMNYGVETDYNKAFKLFTSSEQAGFQYGYYFIAYSYIYAKGTTADLDMANSVFQMIYPVRSPEYYTSIHKAYLYEHGRVDKYNNDNRYNEYSRASSHGVYCGSFGLGNFNLVNPNTDSQFNPQKEWGVDLLIKSADDDCLDANIRLSEFYSTGSFVDKDLKKAARYNKNAAKLLFLDKFEEHTRFVYLSPEEYYGRPHIIKWLKKEAAAGNEKAIAVINLLKSRKNIPGNYNWIDVDLY